MLLSMILNILQIITCVFSQNLEIPDYLQSYKINEEKLKYVDTGPPEW